MTTPRYNAFYTSTSSYVPAMTDISNSQLHVTDFTDDTVMALMERMNGAAFIPVVIKCPHCGQWCARKTACVHCGAPVD